MRKLASFREIDSRIYMEIIMSHEAGVEVDHISLLRRLRKKHGDLFEKDPFLDQNKVLVWLRMVARNRQDISFAVRPYRHVVVELSHDRWLEEIIQPELRALGEH